MVDSLLAVFIDLLLYIYIYIYIYTFCLEAGIISHNYFGSDSESGRYCTILLLRKYQIIDN